MKLIVDGIHWTHSSEMELSSDRASCGVTIDLFNEVLRTWNPRRTAAVSACVAILCLTGIGAALAQNVPKEGPSKTSETTSAVDGTTNGGRHVHASGDVTLGIHVEGEVVTINIGEPHFDAKGKMSVDHTLRIENARLILDGKTQGKIPQSATSLQVTCTKSKLSVVADKQKVFAATLSK